MARRRRLAEDRETPTIVAMHHPPILTGIGGLDDIGLTNRDALGAPARSAHRRCGA